MFCFPPPLLTQDLRAFHEEVPNLLNTGGIYSFFNGLAASTNQFFHDVYCCLVDLELRECNIRTEYVPMDVNPLSNAVWQGVKRPYWVLGEYRLPVCQFVEDFDETLVQATKEHVAEAHKAVEAAPKEE